MMRRQNGRCWPAGIRVRSTWGVAARGGAGHASTTWRAWMEPVRPDPRALPATDDATWREAKRVTRDESKRDGD